MVPKLLSLLGSAEPIAEVTSPPGLSTSKKAKAILSPSVFKGTRNSIL